MQTYLINVSEQIIPWIMTHGLKIVLLIFGAYFLHIIARKFILKMVSVAVSSSGIISEEAERKRVNTLTHIFTLTIKIVIFTVTTLMVMHEFGIMIGPILAAAGIIGLAVGFGGQYLIRDIITGLFIILENQYRIGDVVRFDTVGGTVEAISLRKTTLRDLEGTVHHIPHGEIKVVSNFTKDFSRIKLDLSVSYSSDLDQVMAVVNKTGSELALDPLWQNAVITAPQFARVEDFTDSAMVIRIVGETLPHSKWDVAGEFRKRIKLAFDQEGIEIPFPQQVVHHIHENNLNNNQSDENLAV